MKLRDLLLAGAILLAGLVTPAWAQAPNKSDVVAQVAREQSRLLSDNTYESCVQFTQKVLERLGPEWAFVGKTRGESQAPAPFIFINPVKGLDGNDYFLTGVSYDAIYYLPTLTQVDIIGNAAANSDPNPQIHGPAVIHWDEIPKQFYRKNNPPVLQVALPSLPPNSVPVPTPPIPDNTIGALSSRIAALEGLIQVLYGRIDEALFDAERLEQKIDLLVASSKVVEEQLKNPPAYSGRTLLGSVTLRPMQP